MRSDEQHRRLPRHHPTLQSVPARAPAMVPRPAGRAILPEAWLGRQIFPRGSRAGSSRHGVGSRLTSAIAPGRPTRHSSTIGGTAVDQRGYFPTPPELHTDDEDISCSRCRHELPNVRETEQLLRGMGRPTADTCMVVVGLHVHRMNRRHFTCRHFEPRQVMQ